MIGLEDRRRLAHDIDTAHQASARLRTACEAAGITVRTLQRWQAQHGLDRGDARPQAQRPMPAHALSTEERARILELANAPRFAALPPAPIVPMLADEGVYVASESSFQRSCARTVKRITAATRGHRRRCGRRARVSGHPIMPTCGH